MFSGRKREEHFLLALKPSSGWHEDVVAGSKVVKEHGVDEARRNDRNSEESGRREKPRRPWIDGLWDGFVVVFAVGAALTRQRSRFTDE